MIRGLALSDEQKLILETAQRFAKDVVAPTAASRDHERRFPHDELKALAELGFMGIKTPEGTGAGMFSYALAIAAISRACASTGVTLAVCNLVADLLSRFGSEEQKTRLLEPYLTGALGAGAFCLSEPGCGSDAGALAAKARLDGDFWVLDGTKQWITNGAHSGVFIVFARAAEGDRGDVTAFIVERDAPGLVIGKEEKKLGIRSSNTVQIVLDGCRVPKANLLGDVGAGYRIALSGLDAGRVGIAAQSLGIAEAALDEGIQYALERTAFKKPLTAFQNTQFQIADSRTELDQAWLLTARACALLDAKGRASMATSMAKLAASETCCRVVDRMLQLHGGYGYVEEYAIERLYRDARVTRIYEGTSEVQRIVIARGALAE